MNKMAKHTFAPLIQAFTGNLVMCPSGRAGAICSFISVTGGAKSGGIIGKLPSQKIKIITSMETTMTRGTGYLALVI